MTEQTVFGDEPPQKPQGRETTCQKAKTKWASIAKGMERAVMLHPQRKGWVYWAAWIPVGRKENLWDTFSSKHSSTTLVLTSVRSPNGSKLPASPCSSSCVTHTITQFSLIGTQPIPRLLIVKLAPLQQWQLEVCSFVVIDLCLLDCSCSFQGMQLVWAALSYPFLVVI